MFYLLGLPASRSLLVFYDIGHLVEHNTFLT